MTNLVYRSPSRAMDGGLVAVVDIANVLDDRGVSGYRLIGGIAVVLHTQRAGLDLRQRATRDAEIGITTLALNVTGLAADIEALGYGRVGGNRWERAVAGTVASVDLLVPAHTSRARANVQIGDVTTTEVLGLAEAFQRPPEIIDATFVLFDGTEVTSRVQLTDAVGMLAVKCGARRSRNDARDATDLWRCLEVAFADGVAPESFDAPPWNDVKDQLVVEFIEPGRALPHVVAGLADEEATRLITRIRGLMLTVTGVSS